MTEVSEQVTCVVKGGAVASQDKPSQLLHFCGLALVEDQRGLCLCVCNDAKANESLWSCIRGAMAIGVRAKLGSAGASVAHMHKAVNASACACAAMVVSIRGSRVRVRTWLGSL